MFLKISKYIGPSENTLEHFNIIPNQNLYITFNAITITNFRFHGAFSQFVELALGFEQNNKILIELVLIRTLSGRNY